jgi:hypothetical protein
MMNSTSQKSDYLMIFRGTEWHRGLSPEEIQQAMTQWMAWFERLVEDGRCKGGQSLSAESRVISGKAKSVSDGPYAEAKESVAGYFQLHVSSIDEAAEIAKDCPALPYGIIIEVRPLLGRCEASERILAQKAGAAATA